MDTSSMADQFYKAFKTEDPSLLQSIVTPDFEIRIPEMEHLPLKAVYVGQSGFAQLLSDRRGEIDYDEFKECKRVVTDDLVVVLGRTKGEALKQGRTFAHEWVHVFEFAGGRIKRFKEYIDTSHVCRAFAP